jgi:hypothetical protein
VSIKKKKSGQIAANCGKMWKNDANCGALRMNWQLFAVLQKHAL